MRHLPLRYGGGAFELPPSHHAGMRVPLGGAMCANCKHVSEDRTRCDSPDFSRWNGGSNELPAPADRYCSDWWEPRGNVNLNDDIETLALSVEGIALISAAKRKALPESKFALPEKRAYPIDTPARIRNAEARLEQNRGRLTPQEYAKAKRRIGAAAKRAGIDSKYNKPATRTADLGPSDVHTPGAGSFRPVRKPKALHVRADLAPGGSLHVRHLRDDVFAVGSIELDAKLCKDAAPKWNQLAKPGTFRGHGQGPFTLDENVFRQVIDNFKREGQPIPIDHEHQSELPAGELGPSGAPAMGWIRDMKIANGNLYGLVEWNDLARSQIEAGEYKFFSPAFRFKSKDRVTGADIGARMTSGAMTNNPFLTGMQPLAASDAVANASGVAPSTDAVQLSRLEAMRVGKFDDFAPKLRAALKLGELASYGDMRDTLARLEDMYDRAGSAHAHFEGVDLGAYTQSLAGLMGAGPNATVAEILHAVHEMIEAAMAQHEATYHGAPEEPDDATETRLDDDEELDDEPSEAMRAADRAATQTHQEGGAMDFTLQLKEQNDKIAALTDKLTTLTSKYEESEKSHAAEKAELKLELKEATGKLSALESENKSLKDAEIARDKQAKAERVEEAFLTYKDKKNLTDDDKADMLLSLENNPERFEKRFPRLNPAERHLVRNLAAGSGNGRPGSGGESGGAAPVLSLRQLAHKIAAEKKISLGQAQQIAETIAARQRRAG